MQAGGKIPTPEVLELVAQLDLDKNGTVDYAEFLAATLHASKANKEEHLQRAFATFDTDGSGATSNFVFKIEQNVFGILVPKRYYFLYRYPWIRWTGPLPRICPTYRNPT